MLWFLKNGVYPIGVDMGNDIIKVAQLANNGKGISLIAGGSIRRPENVKPGSSNWQRWAIDAIRELAANAKFRGRNVIAAVPTNDVFIDYVTIPNIKDTANDPGKAPSDHNDKLRQAVFAKVKQKLPFQPEHAMIKHIKAEENNVLVIASERRKINLHLAIYEKANLHIKAINVWPIALTNTYTTFFGRRQTDMQATVMLLQIDTNYTNLVICRHKNILFARSIPIGTYQLQNDEAAARLVLELTACRRRFSSIRKNARIERLIFLTTRTEITKTFATIAKQLEIPAQMGNCLAAVKIEDACRDRIDRRNCQLNWATAFGLSLSLS